MDTKIHKYSTQHSLEISYTQNITKRKETLLMVYQWILLRYLNYTYIFAILFYSLVFTYVQFYHLQSDLYLKQFISQRHFSQLKAVLEFLQGDAVVHFFISFTFTKHFSLRPFFSWEKKEKVTGNKIMWKGKVGKWCHIIFGQTLFVWWNQHSLVFHSSGHFRLKVFRKRFRNSRRNV